MVVRLEGEINGESVVLYRNKDSPGSPEIWDAVIPATLNGKYVIGLTAYDEAGNIGYYATYIITGFSLYASDIRAVRYLCNFK